METKVTDDYLRSFFPKNLFHVEFNASKKLGDTAKFPSHINVNHDEMMKILDNKEQLKKIPFRYAIPAIGKVFNFHITEIFEDENFKMDGQWKLIYLMEELNQSRK